MLLYVDQEKLEDAGRIVNGLGSGLRGAWRQIREAPGKIFDLPVLSNRIDDEKQKELVQLGETLGLVAGFVAVGGHGLGGALKVASGQQQKDTSRKLDGIMDMATAATLGATVAGMTGARLVLAPLAAGFNIFRGGYNAGHGFKTHDGRKQLQGALDAVRSAGTVGRLLKGVAPVFKVAGIALAPIAGTIQAGRGVHDLSTGLKNDDNNKKIKGLVDIATAVGTAMAFASGVAIIPGVALAVAANLTRAAYQVSPKVRGKIDPLLERYEPQLESFVTKSERLTKPVVRAWEKTLGKLVKRKEAPGLEKYSKSQLAEITQLLFADGDYSRSEERRLRIALERVGQGAETPARSEPAPSTNRSALKRELQSEEQRLDFLRFLLVVANFDNREDPAEIAYVEDLATALGVGSEELEELRQERLADIG